MAFFCNCALEGEDPELCAEEPWGLWGWFESYVKNVWRKEHQQLNIEVSGVSECYDVVSFLVLGWMSWCLFWVNIQSFVNLQAASNFSQGIGKARTSIRKVKSLVFPIGKYEASRFYELTPSRACSACTA